MVYFVGAGTGAADLITVRGMRLLERADVIIYAGSLVNPELLAYAGKTCEIHNSAKLTLDEVIEIMKCDEESGTVRKDNCPAAYGRPECLWCGAGTDGRTRPAGNCL